MGKILEFLHQNPLLVAVVCFYMGCGYYKSKSSSVVFTRKKPTTKPPTKRVKSTHE